MLIPSVLVYFNIFEYCLISSHTVFSFYELKSYVEEFHAITGVVIIKSWFLSVRLHLCPQVVSAATSCPSQSSPPTADCGSSSAAAVTGWEKVSPPFMRVSTHSPDLAAPNSSTPLSWLNAWPVTHPTMCLEAAVISTVFGSPTADVSGTLRCINQILAGLHTRLHCFQTVQRDDVCVCVCEGGSWWWRHFS